MTAMAALASVGKHLLKVEGLHVGRMLNHTHS